MCIHIYRYECIYIYIYVYIYIDTYAMLQRFFRHRRWKIALSCWPVSMSGADWLHGPNDGDGHGHADAD